MKYLLILIATVALLLGAGCGGEDEDAGGGGETLSEGEYANEVRAIVTNFGIESVALGIELSEAKSSEELGSAVDGLRGLTETTVDDLTAITPPEELAEGHAKVESALEGHLDDVGTLEDAIEAGDETAAREAVIEFQAAEAELQAGLQEAMSQLVGTGVTGPQP